MDPQAPAEAVHPGKILVISKERPGHRTQDTLSVQDETRLLLVRRRLLQMIGQGLIPSFDEVCEIFNNAMRQMLRAISAVDEFDARHIDFNGNESESSDSDKDEAVHLEACRLSQVLRSEDLAEQHKHVIESVSCCICSHWSLLSALRTFASMRADCCCGASISRSCARRRGFAGEWNPIGTMLYPIFRRPTGMTMVSSSATVEDQTAPMPQKARDYEVKRPRLMHGHPVGVEKLKAGNADVFPFVGRTVRAVGLHHRDSIPTDDEDNDEDPFDGVVGDDAAAA